MAPFFTREGDDGHTGLLGGGRVPKHDLQPQAFGSVDEASACLGLARALAQTDETRETILRVQRDLYHLMAELAATIETAETFRKIESESVEWIETQIERLGEEVELPKDFILTGDAVASAALDLARTVVRRAERWVAQCADAGRTANPHLLRYLNRLSSLCFLLMVWELQAADVGGPTLAKKGNG
jgi:cob(I)alamin adenosyltransferase